MNYTHIALFAFGIAQIAYAVLGFATGHVDPASAGQMLLAGLAVFGLTKQNVNLGNRLAGR